MTTDIVQHANQLTTQVTRDVYLVEEIVFL